MSKRFYAACAAMQGLYSMAFDESVFRGFEKSAKDTNCASVAEYIAKKAYTAADYLLTYENQ